MHSSYPFLIHSKTFSKDSNDMVFHKLEWYGSNVHTKQVWTVEQIWTINECLFFGTFFCSYTSSRLTACYHSFELDKQLSNLNNGIFAFIYCTALSSLSLTCVSVYGCMDSLHTGDFFRLCIYHSNINCTWLSTNSAQSLFKFTRRGWLIIVEWGSGFHWIQNKSEKFPFLIDWMMQ